MRSQRARVAVFLLVPVLATTLAGCRTDVRVEIDVHGDGSATAGLVVHLDEEATAWLAAGDVDPAALVADAVAEPWRVEQGTGDGWELRLHREVDDAADLGDVLRGLAAGLTADDPAVLVDIDVDRPDRRTTRLAGDVEVRPPGSAPLIVDGRAVGPSADELAALAAEFVSARLVVRLPGALVDHDGDRVVDGVEFDLAVGETRGVLVESRASGEGIGSRVLLLAAVLGVVAAVLVARSVPSGRRGAPDAPETVRTGE